MNGLAPDEEKALQDAWLQFSVDRQIRRALIHLNEVSAGCNAAPATARNALSLAGVAAALNSALGSSGLSAAARYGGLTLETAVAGPGATLDYAAAPASGTDVSALLGLTRESGAQLWQGYTPEGLAAEATLARTASHCNQRPVSTAGPLTPARACSHLALLPSACVASEPSESHVCLYTLLPDEPAAPWQRTKLFIV